MYVDKGFEKLSSPAAYLREVTAGQYTARLENLLDVCFMRTSSRILVSNIKVSEDVIMNTR